MKPLLAGSAHQLNGGFSPDPINKGFFFTNFSNLKMRNMKKQEIRLWVAVVVVAILALIGWFKPNSEPKFKKGDIVYDVSTEKSETFVVDEDSFDSSRVKVSRVTISFSRNLGPMYLNLTCASFLNKDVPIDGL